MAQPVQSHCDEPVDRSLGGQAAGYRESVQAAARELVGGDIVPERAARRGETGEVSRI